MTMKQFTPEELTEVLRLHKLWAQDKEGGQRADLQRADLQRANLQDADLQDADLRGAYLRHADLQDANLQDANLQDADLRGAYLQGADLRGAYLQDADLRGADLWGAYLQGADGCKFAIASMAVFSGLYNYQCWAVASADGVPWVRMGCLWKSVEEWDRVGIRASNPGEFPNDHSEKCERRVRAFEFVRAEAMLMAKNI